MGVGLGSFQRRMKAIPEAVRTSVVPGLVKAGEIVADTIRALAPVDEGDLKASVAVTGPGQATPPYSQPGGEAVVAANATAVTVGNSAVRYPHLIEYGTTKSAAKPFFWPGFYLSKKRAGAAVKRAIGKAVREAK